MAFGQIVAGYGDHRSLSALIRVDGALMAVHVIEGGRELTVVTGLDW
ncbi:MAG: hypothetical protein ACE5EL_03690 [Anaerolineae bacterium]